MPFVSGLRPFSLHRFVKYFHICLNMHNTWKCCK